MNLNKQTLSEQIYQILREDILSQRIPCGCKLTLKTLQERFSVSSTPIREALTRLTEEQLVSYYSNVGVSVVELGHEDLVEIYQFMGDLDSLAVQYASSYSDQAVICAALRDNLTQMETCSPSSQRWQELSDEFHLIFYRFCGNSRLVRSASRMRSQLSIAAYQYEKNGAVQQDILSEHQAIAQAYLKGQHNEAAKLMKEHLLHSLAHAKSLF